MSAEKTYILLEFLISVISVPSFSWKWLFVSCTLSMMLITSFLKCSNWAHHGEWCLDLNPKDVLVSFSLLLPFKKKCAFHCMPLITLSIFSINVSWHELEFFLKELLQFSFSMICWIYKQCSTNNVIISGAYKIPNDKLLQFNSSTQYVK